MINPAGKQRTGLRESDAPSFLDAAPNSRDRPLSLKIVPCPTEVNVSVEVVEGVEVIEGVEATPPAPGTLESSHLVNHLDHLDDLDELAHL